MAEGSLRLSSEGMRVVADATSGLDRKRCCCAGRTLNTTRLPVLVPDSLLVGGYGLGPTRSARRSVGCATRCWLHFRRSW